MRNQLRVIIAAALMLALGGAGWAQGPPVVVSGGDSDPSAAIADALTTFLADNNVFSGANTFDTILIADGDTNTPGWAFATDSRVGMFRGAGETILQDSVGAMRYRFSGTGQLTLGYSLADSTPPCLSFATFDPDTLLCRYPGGSAVMLHALSNPNQVYTAGYFLAAGIRYSFGVIGHAVETLAGVTGGSVTASGLVPSNVQVIGVNTIVVAALGTSNGTTGYQVGDGADSDRYGDVTGTAAGTDTDNGDATADPTEWTTATADIVITATGGDFDGTGNILVDVFYLTTLAE